MKTEFGWERKLNICTIDRDDTKEDANHYPYEPTPYSVLERMVDGGYITHENNVIDLGSGKGRVGFFLNDQIGCKVLGIDYDERMYALAQENLSRYGSDRGVEFACISAEKYEISDADCFYFFNPFSTTILRAVISKIRKSYYENPRTMTLFFYYPSDEYVSYLMTVSELCFVDEIDCRDLFEGQNEREKVLIFAMEG